MSTVNLVSDEAADETARDVFEDIRSVRKTDFINNFWRAAANDSQEMKAVWEDIKRVMGPGALDPLTKEMIYIAVSVANACTYCAHSHTASARAKGMTDEMHAELMRVIGLAARTNHLANAMQVPVDEAFDKS
ncbi:MAG: carboxymuconolactone decarboxylase family protein [Nitratireductor sp.]|nr:carboxymuconolactone decarboxylase family protein [Nitratireductor sp.]MCC0021356.1 carboxymuconolactone decarboxylase family protein [Nitratireductor sp.]